MGLGAQESTTNAYSLKALHKSIEAQAEEPPGEMETSNKPFRRAVDAFRRSPGSAHYNLTTSSRLAEAAALLLGTSGVRVFYDELFFKEFGDQPTAVYRFLPVQSPQVLLLLVY